MAAAAPQTSSPWVHGPTSDFLLGAGMIYLPVFVLLIFAGGALEQAVPFGWMPLGVLLFSTPHVGATLLRVYERREDRQAYRYFAVHLSLVLALWLVLALYVPLAGSLLITLYLTIVPWHFTGQNYGITLLFLRRRGITIEGTTKRLLYVSFVTTYLMTVVASHGAAISADYAPLQAGGTVYHFMSIGLPTPFVFWALIIGVLVWFGCLLEVGLRLSRVAALRDLLPSAAVVFTQVLWYLVPLTVFLVLSQDRMGPLAQSKQPYTFMWASLTHGVQYLWITTYFSRRRDPDLSQTRYLTKALLVGASIYGIPLLIFSPQALGQVPFNAGLFLMISGAINVHHVLLDSAIWKLRDGRLAQILVRGEQAQDALTPARSAAFWRPVRYAIYASGVLGALFYVFGTIETEIGHVASVANGDLGRLETAAKRLRWMGRDDPGLHADIGFLRAQRGDAPGAIEAFERSNELFENSVAWLNIGVLNERDGRVDAALDAYQRALAIDDRDPTTLLYAGRASLKLGETERAQRWLEQAAQLAPDRDDIRALLEQARG